MEIQLGKQPNTISWEAEMLENRNKIEPDETDIVLKLQTRPR